MDASFMEIVNIQTKEMILGSDEYRPPRTIITDGYFADHIV